MHATLSDWLLEPVANAVEAGATAVVVEIVERGPWVEMCVADDGPGMDPAARQGARDALASSGRRGRRAHFGLPLLEQTIRATGGRFDVSSEPGRGTSVCWSVDTRHVDAPPSGDWAGAITMALTRALERGVALRVRRARDGREYSVCNLDWAGDGQHSGAGGWKRLRSHVDAAEADLMRHGASGPGGQVRWGN